MDSRVFSERGWRVESIRVPVQRKGMTSWTRPPESRIDVVIGPPDDPEIKGHIFQLTGAPSVKTLLAGLSWQEDFPQEDFPIEGWYSLVLNGKFFHKEFGRYTVEMIGSQVAAETAKNFSPCQSLQYGEMFSESHPLLLWRQRVFYQAEKVWVPSLETTLSPTYPQVPYIESVWHPSRRTQEIVLSCPINTPKSIRDSLLKNGRRMLQQIETEDNPLSRGGSKARAPLSKDQIRIYHPTFGKAHEALRDVLESRKYKTISKYSDIERLAILKAAFPDEAPEIIEALIQYKTKRDVALQFAMWKVAKIPIGTWQKDRLTDYLKESEGLNSN